MEKLKSFNQYVKEALLPSMYREYMDPKLFNRERYEKMFKEFKEKYDGDRNAFRIYLPLLKKKKDNPLENEITKFLDGQGYKVLDYFKGTCKFKTAKNPKKIGTVLTKLKEDSLMKRFVEDPERKKGSGELMVVVSRHPYDIVGSDTDRDWTNCMTMALSDLHPRMKKMKAEGDRDAIGRHTHHGENVKWFKGEVKEGSLMAYLIKKDDRNINKPLGVLNIKPYEKDGEIYLNACQRGYGTRNDDFNYTVVEWLREVNMGKRGIFTLNPRVYNDNDIAKINVGVLDISHKSLTTLRDYEKNIETVYLKCNNNSLTNLKGVEKMKEIEELHCNFNKIESLEGIENLKTLQVLNCSNNNLKDLKGVENLENLEQLFCEVNSLTSLKELENLDKIKVLHCEGNKLTSLEGIENLKNLKELFCFSNNLTNLAGIEKLKNLEKLNCFDNKLTNLKGIEDLPKIKLFCAQNDFEFPVPAKLKSKVVAKMYTKANIEKFKTYECQKEFLTRWPKRAKELAEFGINDQIKEEFPDLF